MLSIRGLERAYVTGERTLEVLKGVDLDVRPGEVVGLIGPSGSGKSSLLHAAGLLEHPTAGRSWSTARTARSWPTARAPACAWPDRLRLPVPPSAAGVHGPRQRRPADPDRRRARRREARGAGGGAAGPAGPGRAAEPPAGPALRRRAAAGGRRPGAGQPAAAGAGRRAHRQPRSGHLRGGVPDLHDLVRTPASPP